MSKSGPIVIVDDNKKEWLLYREALHHIRIKNELKFFENGEPALDYLKETKDSPFLIICDMRMQVLSGLEFRKKISEDPYLVLKATPFVFRTNTVTTDEIVKAYELTVQGFFAKSDDFEEMSKQLKIIVDYWKESYDPNTRF